VAEYIQPSAASPWSTPWEVDASDGFPSLIGADRWLAEFGFPSELAAFQFDVDSEEFSDSPSDFAGYGWATGLSSSAIFDWVHHNHANEIFYVCGSLASRQLAQISRAKNSVNVRLVDLEAQICSTRSEQAGLLSQFRGGADSCVKRLNEITLQLSKLLHEFYTLQLASRFFEGLRNSIITVLRSLVSARCMFLMQASWFFYHADVAPPLNWQTAA